MPSSRIRKAVIPAAGFGTRVLPATKAVPKEMLPIGGRPVIQYAIEEAAASGLEAVILVIGPGKDLISEHFRRNTGLEDALVSLGRTEDAKAIRQLAELIKIETVWQEKPIGLAHAIGLARPLVSDEPFAVILPDALIDAEVPCIRQLIECYASYPGCLVATQLVQPEEVERFGVVEVERTFVSAPQISKVASLFERPASGVTKSRLGIFGRYILVPQIFRFIAELKPGRGGELQLTDALSLCAKSVPLYAYNFKGQHFDVGSKLGFVQATINYALREPELVGPLIEYLTHLAVPVPTRLRQQMNLHREGYELHDSIHE